MIVLKPSLESFRLLIGDVSKRLVGAEFDAGGSFIRLPILYPSGTNVVVRVEGANDRFFVSDYGLGAQEADLMGASLLYARHGRPIAETAGVRFDNEAFFIVEATRDHLPGAVVTIANCSQEAAMRAADGLSEKSFEDAKDVLYDRLARVFDRKIITRNASLKGSSATEYKVAAMVRPARSSRVVVFDPVTKHHSSVAHASMKFGDMSRLDSPPIRVAAVHNKSEFGTLLNILSASANVIDDSVSDETLLRLANVA